MGGSRSNPTVNSEDSETVRANMTLRRRGAAQIALT